MTQVLEVPFDRLELSLFLGLCYLHLCGGVAEEGRDSVHEVAGAHGRNHHRMGKY